MNTPPLTFGHTAQSLSLTIRLFSWRHLVHPCGQVHVSIHLKGFDFGAGASFLVGTLSVRGDVKLASLWVMADLSLGGS